MIISCMLRLLRVGRDRLSYLQQASAFAFAVSDASKCSIFCCRRTRRNKRTCRRPALNSAWSPIDPSVAMVRLSLFVFEELAGHNDADAVAIWVSLAREIEVEIDRTHDAVAKFFVDQFLQGRAVYLHDLVEAIDGRISWNCHAERATIGDLCEKGFGFPNAQCRCRLGGNLFR